MPQLDFKEIAQGNISNGEQDSFELFAREFMELLGYEVLSGPDRGSDLGRDIIVQEARTGISGGTTLIKWLVSCKHKAHSGTSVGLTDEQNIMDRVDTHGCHGFIGFYSTLPASSLTRMLEGFKSKRPNFEFQILDKEKIEGILLRTGPGLGIAQRFFPNSYIKWEKTNHDIDLAMLRVGMPTPVSFKIEGDDKLYTAEEITQLYPQGNQFLFTALMPQKMIFCNNIFGITKLVGPSGLEDIPDDYLERLAESMRFNMEHIRQQMLAAAEATKVVDQKRRSKAKKPRKK